MVKSRTSTPWRRRSSRSSSNDGSDGKKKNVSNCNDTGTKRSVSSSESAAAVLSDAAVVFRRSKRNSSIVQNHRRSSAIAAKEESGKSHKIQTSTRSSSSNAATLLFDANDSSTFDSTISSFQQQQQYRESAAENSIVLQDRDIGGVENRGRRSSVTRNSIGTKTNVTSPLSSRVSSSFVTTDLTIDKLPNFAQIPLHGRDLEVQQLQARFRNIVTNNRDDSKNVPHATEVMFISGHSGTGKSRLADTLKQIVKEQSGGGFYALGKFEYKSGGGSNGGGTPYSGIASACRRLCEQILLLKEEEDDDDDDNNKDKMHKSSTKVTTTTRKRKTYKDFQNALSKELGTERQLLTEVIPALREIFGFENFLDLNESPPQERSRDNITSTTTTMKRINSKIVLDVDKLEARNRFNFAFKRFLRVVSSFGPLVLVLDDLQCADTSSLDLLDVLIRDVDNQALMVVGCYRNNEFDNDTDHILRKFIDELRNCNTDDFVSLTEISVGDLSKEETNKVIADILSMDTDRTESLSRILHERTRGNAFYVLELILALHRHDLIKFNFGLMTWTWDDHKIEESTRVTNNVVELIQQRLTTHIYPSVAARLPIAAYLGATFDSSVFEFVVSAIPLEEMLSYLDASELEASFQADPTDHCEEFFAHCQEEGILMPSGEQSYCFSHDRLQEAVLALVADEYQKHVGFRIGRMLLQLEETTNEVERLFSTVNLLNLGIEFMIEEVEERLALAALNLQAGQNSQSLSAFDASNEYLRLAMELLPQDHWETHYELSLSIFNVAADAAYCKSDWEKMNRICDAVVSQKNRPLSDKYHAHRLILEGLVVRSKFAEAEKKCLSTLELIGCKFPRSDFLQTLSLIKGVLKAKKLVTEKTEEDIRNLPDLNDPDKKFGLLVMETLIAAAMGTGSKMTALPMLRQFEWIFEYGICSQSNVVFAGIGLVLTAIMGELKLGQKASHFGQIVYDRIQTKSTEARMLVCRYGLTLHMIEPFSDCMQRLLHGYYSGMEIGDLNYGMWSIQLYLMLAQCSGRRLDALNQDYPSYIRQMKEAEQKPAEDYAIVHWQAIQNLIGRGGTVDDPTCLTGDVMDQEVSLKNLVESKKVTVVDLIHCRRVYLGCLFGRYQTAADLALELGEQFYQKSPGWPTFVETFFYGAISCLSAFKVTKKKKYLRYARAQNKKMETWLKQGSANFVHWKTLLDVELYVLSRSAKVDKAKQFFQKAVIAVARTGRIHEHALVRVRFAEYLLSVNVEEKGIEEDAFFQLQEARRLFSEWGANALVLVLTERYPRLQEIHCSSSNLHIPSSILLLD